MLFAAYTRYNDTDPLEHDLRAEIYEVVTRSPGLYLAEVVERTAGAESTVRHHVRVLEDENLVEPAPVWGNLRLFPTSIDPDHYELVAALRSESSARVLGAVARLEPVTVSALAETLDRAPSTVSHHLARFEEARLIARERDGESVLTTLTPSVRDLLPVDGDRSAVDRSLRRACCTPQRPRRPTDR